MMTSMGNVWLNNNSVSLDFFVVTCDLILFCKYEIWFLQISYLYLVSTCGQFNNSITFKYFQFIQKYVLHSGSPSAVSNANTYAR